MAALAQTNLEIAANFIEAHRSRLYVHSDGALKAGNRAIDFYKYNNDAGPSINFVMFLHAICCVCSEKNEFANLLQLETMHHRSKCKNNLFGEREKERFRQILLNLSFFIVIAIYRYSSIIGRASSDASVY